MGEENSVLASATALTSPPSQPGLIVSQASAKAGPGTSDRINPLRTDPIRHPLPAELRLLLRPPDPRWSEYP